MFGRSATVGPMRSPQQIAGSTPLLQPYRAYEIKKWELQQRIMS
jgi:hypothetical protein